MSKFLKTLLLSISLMGVCRSGFSVTDDALRLMAAEADASRGGSTDTTARSAQDLQRQQQTRQSVIQESQIVAPPPAQPLPPVVSTADSNVFGAKLFGGYFRVEQPLGFNPNYQISIGDKIVVRMWGGYESDRVLVVDPRGHIFIPNIGPVYVLGVTNQNLNSVVESNVRKVYRSNVGVYASLETAQPVKVFVTGFVRNPGLYSGLSSDSPLSYLDRAGGIDPDRGSYLEVLVLRQGVLRRAYNLYDFLLSGHMDLIQFSDGDTIVVTSRKHVVTVTGEAYNPYTFEFSKPEISLEELLAMVKPKPNATHVSILRKSGTMTTSEYHYLPLANGVMIRDGDEVLLMADKFPGTILVRVSGAHSGEHALVLPYGATMEDALKRIVVNPRSNLAAIQLYRQSVATRQKEMLDTSLQTLQAQTLTATSSTREEAQLRKDEADQVARFIEQAKKVVPKGLVVLGGPSVYRSTLLEDGDILKVPEKTSLVMVHGEVIFPNAILHRSGATVSDYVQLAGGYTQNADKARIIIAHPDGSAEGGLPDSAVLPGDEVMVLMKIDTKNIETTRGISQILYQIALSAKVLLGL